LLRKDLEDRPIDIRSGGYTAAHSTSESVFPAISHADEDRFSIVAISRPIVIMKIRIIHAFFHHFL